MRIPLALEQFVQSIAPRKARRMNYLAHMVVGTFAGLDAEGMLGNFVGDAVKGRHVEAQWGPSIARGIRLHRALDEASDRHAASQEARRVLRPWCGKWSGVVWDVLADHVLADGFDQLTPQLGTLENFANQQTNALRNQQEAMPLRSQRFFEAMVRHGWLVGYANPVVVDQVLHAMSQRRTMAFPVSKGWDAFEAHQDLLKSCARDLVKDMIQWGQTRVNPCLSGGEERQPAENDLSLKSQPVG